MLIKHFFISLLLLPIKILFRVKPKSNYNLEELKSILIIWPNNRFGFFLSARILFKAIKEKYPDSKIYLYTRDKSIKRFYKEGLIELLGFNKNDIIIGPKDCFSFLSTKFDVAILPVIKKFSTVNHLLLRFSKSKTRIGIASLNEQKNPYSFLFDKKIESNWNSLLDNHISDYFFELIKPIGIYQQSILGNKNDPDLMSFSKKEILSKAGISANQKIIVINNEPEEIQNKWGIENLVGLISLLVNSGDYFFYYIEDNMDPMFKKMLEADVKILHYVNKNDMKHLNQIISVSDLIITCDSNVMHFAGLTQVPQISIFGISNPFNWAPLGPNKKFIKKSDLINDVTAKDVFDLAEFLLATGNKHE